MPIAAEEFTTQHFDKLVRGIGVAREAFDRALKDAHYARTRAAELRSFLDDAEARETELAHAQVGLDNLIERVHDCARGLRTLDELITYVKEQHP